MHTRQRYWFILAILFVLLSIGLGGWVWSSILSLQKTANQQTTNGSSSNVASVTPALNGGLDVSSGAHLIIPAIGINAPIETVGKTAQGLMDVPTRNRWEGVGWYNGGPLPGQPGAAVIDGHLDRTGGAPAVFWKLKDLHVGDMVTVQDKSGTVVRFKVIKLASYAPTQAPIKEIFGQKNGTFLNLITCAGVWIADEHQTTERLVVYTRKVA
ncbi:class F sortase [Dictyobacter kobayashii]|uniref:Class F sortase n=1 Tax=Dictyobacter kobayashii TaxID=2014872 RepID=A0A402AHV1_9CHLR|nr:class F sortase [Dictyobacter kobayashii]GCE18614.1 class F sortase [Dictyobacter kobayashii]